MALSLENCAWRNGKAANIASIRRSILIELLLTAIIVVMAASLMDGGVGVIDSSIEDVNASSKGCVHCGHLKACTGH